MSDVDNQESSNPYFEVDVMAELPGDAAAELAWLRTESAMRIGSLLSSISEDSRGIPEGMTNIPKTVYDQTGETVEEAEDRLILSGGKLLYHGDHKLWENLQRRAKSPIMSDQPEDLGQCKICGEIHQELSKSGRCQKCKSKRLPNNTARIGAARAKLGQVDNSKTIADLEAEIAQLRHLLSSRSVLALEDFQERVRLLSAAGVESYEDGGVKIVFKTGQQSKPSLGGEVINY